MIASLPMYDRPETAHANDRLWELIREHYSGEAPDTLSRGSDPWADWKNPNLLLSQTCSLPYRAQLSANVELVGSPVHDLDCAPGYYFSVLVAREGDDRAFADFAAARLAYNDPLSQSGWAAPWAEARDAGFVFNSVLKTGSHANSAHAVAEGHADLAAIDAVSWIMLERWEDFAVPLQIIGLTKPAPALPYVTARGGDSSGLFAAIEAALANLDPADRDLLCLRGITRLPAETYLTMPNPPAPPDVWNACNSEDV